MVNFVFIATGSRILKFFGRETGFFLKEVLHNIKHTSSKILIHISIDYTYLGTSSDSSEDRSITSGTFSFLIFKNTSFSPFFSLDTFLFFPFLKGSFNFSFFKKEFFFFNVGSFLFSTWEFSFRFSTSVQILLLRMLSILLSIVLVLLRKLFLSSLWNLKKKRWLLLNAYEQKE